MTVVPTLAHFQDEDALVSLLRAKHEEEGIGGFVEPKVRALVRRGLGVDGGMIGVVRGRAGIEAAIGLYVGSWNLFNDDQVIVALFDYVLAPYRRSTHAKDLLEFAKAAAVRIGRPLILNQIHNEQTARKVKLCEREFKVDAGRMFMFDPATV